MRPELTIAEKEFRDHLSSKRFLFILGVLLLLGAYAMFTGMDEYNKSLASYKNQKATGASHYQESIEIQQKMIDNATQNGASAEEIQRMKANLESMESSKDYYLNPAMPSLLQVFQAFTLFFAILGMVLGLAMGFDQLTKEKETGSLKSVLSAPVYRDSLINGKAIGTFATLAVAMGVMFLVVIAIMLFYGVAPGLEDLARIFLFFIASMVYCMAFFAIAMLTSALSKSSAMAILGAIGIVFALVIVSFLSTVISSAVVGFIVPDTGSSQSPMTYTDGAGNTITVYTNVTGDGVSRVYTMSSSGNNTTPMGAPSSYSYDDYDKRWVIQGQISDALNTVSPLYDFMSFDPTAHPGISQALLSKDKPSANGFMVMGPFGTRAPQQASLMDSLSYIWVKVLAVIVEAIIAFALSYAAFMRMDVR